jgi:hypothetical protein
VELGGEFDGGCVGFCRGIFSSENLYMGVSFTPGLPISPLSYPDVVYLWFPAGGHGGRVGGEYLAPNEYQMDGRE